MEWLWNGGILLAAFIGMELFSSVFHKYVMHGALWSIHKTHHVRTKGMFELNDVFSLIFACIATTLVLIGLPGFSWQLWCGLGIIVYGLVYFVVHDIFIHRRIKWLERSNVRYLQVLRRAHKAHHAFTDKDPGEEYGLLWIGRKYWNL
jgi:beta-carotene 3-hydroxylase